MITDFADVDPGATLRADICIVGAGAAGITLARAFAGGRSSVLLLESGGLEYEEETQALYDGQCTGTPHGYLVAGRLRFFGGTTNHWSGRCAPLDPVDFEVREWVPFSGWPITHRDLDPYYDGARAVCGLPVGIEPWAVLNEFGIEPPACDPDRLRTQIWQQSAPVRFGTAYRRELQDAENVRVLLHANVVRLASDDGALVDHVDVRSLGGATARVEAQVYILCCGAIENARVLLNSTTAGGVALGNRYDLVGRFYTEHGRTRTGVLVTDRSAFLQTVYNNRFRADGAHYEIGVALGEAAQREARALNASAVFEYHGDPESGVTAGREIWRELQRGHWADDLGEKLWRVARDLDDVIDSLRRRVVEGLPTAMPLAYAVLRTDIEQAPNPDSRVTLSDDRDALGQRRVHLDWRLTDLDRRTARVFTRTVLTEFARLGLARGRIEPWLEDDQNDWTDHVSSTSHQMGTTRMAADQKQGVVDASCRVHGTGNLYVAGSSIFPTVGHANPTLTIVALALRLADHLKARFALRGAMRAER
ncbi:MAG TPA: GMC family oxidoreductase [Alphaproteobacteria bacterium]|nr:GMC family oxidoreductase [Alphaproteobacteria bacterium]